MSADAIDQLLGPDAEDDQSTEGGAPETEAAVTEGQTTEAGAEGSGDDTGSSVTPTETGDVSSDDQDPLDVDPDTLSKQDRGLLKAAQGERKKRQQLESQLEEFQRVKEEIAQLKQRLPEKESDDEEAGPNIYADPDGYFEQRFAKKVPELVGEVQYQVRVEMDTKRMREKHPDYDKAEARFVQEILPKHPHLAQQLRASEAPAQFAYDQVKMFDLQEQHGGSSNLVGALSEKDAKIAELEQRLAAIESGQTQTQQTREVVTQPKSQAGARGVSSNVAAHSDDGKGHLDLISDNRY